MKKQMRCLSPLLVLLAGCNSAGATESEMVASLALQDAHSSYVSGDEKQMGTAIKEVLFSDPSQEEKDNVMQLLTKAYQDNCDFELPVDWHLPSQIKSMQFELMRASEPDGIWHKGKISGHLTSESAVQQLRLIAFPNQIIADKNAGLGEWEVDVEEDDPTDIYFELSQKFGRETLKPGLYLLEIVTEDGAQTDGWFVLTDQFASQSPTLHRPMVGERFYTATPPLEWDDFRSPEYRACEARQLKVHVSKIPSVVWDPRWGLSVRDPSLTQATIGIGGDGGPLEPGQYWFSLSFREIRKFGPMDLSRRSGTSRNFYVE